MNDLIHKIVGTIIEVGQSDVGKFRLGETIRYTPSEILEILKQHENEIFSEEKTTSDLIKGRIRLIDANAMKADLLTVDPQYETMIQWCITVLDAQPTIEPGIIRCGECRYYRECEIFGKKITLCKRREYDSMYTEPDDFCSRAERRTE